MRERSININFLLTELLIFNMFQRNKAKKIMKNSKSKVEVNLK